MRYFTWLSGSFLLGLGTIASLVGCSSDESLGGGFDRDSGGNGQTGGSSAATTSTGGALTGGGAPGSGGVAASGGGALGSGGLVAPGTGGAPGSGGVAAAGAGGTFGSGGALWGKGGGVGGAGGGDTSRDAAIDAVIDGVIDGASCTYQAMSTSMAPKKSFELSIVQPDGRTLSCSSQLATDGGSGPIAWPGPVTAQIAGTVRATSATSLTVDTCDGSVGCSGGTYRLTVSADGLSLAGLPIGRRVSVSWWIYNTGMACPRMLVVTDATSLDAGTAAPALWLAGADGLTQAQVSLPFSFTRKSLLCNPAPSLAQGCGGNDVAPDDYAFQFAPKTTGAPLSLATDETGTLALDLDPTTVQHITLHTLRCFQTTRCDDYGNWAWWALGQADSTGQPQ